MKTLIVYGTRYGATASTSEEIARVLRDEGFDVRVVNAKEEKLEDISEYKLIIVGSGMKLDRWTKEPEKFLEKFKKELTKKKVAIFVSSAIQVVYVHEGDTEAIERAQRKYLKEKAEKYFLNPFAMTIFGGVLNYDKLGFLTRKTVGQLWRKFEEIGFEKKDGIYDTRDWEAIQKWTQELAHKARSNETQQCAREGEFLSL
jgi:menaquinone-dependent protoporphyrinogen oxidase